MKHLSLPHTNLSFINEKARNFHLIQAHLGQEVYQVHSEGIDGLFYTGDAYVTLKNLMSHEERQTHTATPFSPELVALLGGTILTREDVLGIL